MNDPVFLDSAAFLRVWQRVTGEEGITAAPAQPEPDAITAQLRECICAKAAGAALSAKRGDTPRSKLKGPSKHMAESMSQKELEKMASTKRQGKPEHSTKT